MACPLQGHKVNGHQPSVDVLFRSVANLGARDVTAVILTGMGNDGAQGLLELKRAGARTLAQNKDSSVVFGMPRAAWDLGAAQQQLSPPELLHALLSFAQQHPH
jgi:two-component system chemotaxis response regulator CheB